MHANTTELDLDEIETVTVHIKGIKVFRKVKSQGFELLNDTYHFMLYYSIFLIITPNAIALKFFLNWYYSEMGTNAEFVYKALPYLIQIYFENCNYHITFLQYSGPLHEKI